MFNNRIKKHKLAYKNIKKAEKYNNGRFEDLFDIKSMILAMTKDYDFVITNVNEEISNCSQDSVLITLKKLKFNILYSFGHFNKVVNQVSRLRENGNQDKYLLHLRALSYLALGKFEKAKQDLQEFNHPFFYDINMILLNLLKGNKNKAIQYYSNLNMTKAELYNSQNFQDLIFMISPYKPFKKLLTDFIESRPE